MDKHEEVLKILEDFIDAVHRVDWQPPMGIMNHFPNGCCTVSSFVLGHLLQNHGLGTWHIVNGSAGIIANHDWLESSEGLLVDATPHQFEYGIDPFVAMGPSPLEEHFPPKKIIALDEWTQAHRDAYELVDAAMASISAVRQAAEP